MEKRVTTKQEPIVSPSTVFTNLPLQYWQEYDIRKDWWKSQGLGAAASTGLADARWDDPITHSHMFLMPDHVLVMNDNEFKALKYIGPISLIQLRDWQKQNEHLLKGKK